MCVFTSQNGARTILIKPMIKSQKAIADQKYKTTHKPDIQSKHELTLAQGPGIHTVWTWPVSCLCPPSKTAAGSHGGGCSCQTLVEQLSQDHLLPADQKQKWHATENDPPILISFKVPVRVDIRCQTSRIWKWTETDILKIHTFSFGWGVQVNLVPRLKFPYMDNSIQRSTFAVSNYHLGHSKQNFQ